MVCVVAECLCCAESHEMYAWSLEQLPKSKTEYKLSSTCYMFANQLVIDDLLGMLGIEETCTLRCGNHHLFSSVIPNYFGEQLWMNHLQLLFQTLLVNGGENHWKE